jgi:transmembrane protein EpsG
MKISNNEIICLAFFLIALTLSGFRWDVGIDWMTYYKMYAGMTLFNYDTLSESQEPINILIKNSLVNFGFSDGRFWIWIMAVITLYFISKSILLYSSSVVKSIILFFIMGFFFDSLNGLRQFCAVSISMISWKYALEKNFFKFTAIVIVASLFHFSALCVSVVIFLSKYQINRHIIWKLLLISLIIAPVSTVLAPKLITIIPGYEKYGDANVIKFATGSGNILSYLRMVFPIFLVILIRNNLSKFYISRYWQLITNISLLGLFLLIAFPTTQLVIRLSYYYCISLIFLIPYICSKIGKDGTFIWLTTIIYYILFTTITYLFRPESKILPYKLKFDLFSWDLVILTICVIFFCSLLIPKTYRIWKKN